MFSVHNTVLQADGDGFFLASENAGELFDHSFAAGAFKWR